MGLLTCVAVADSVLLQKLRYVYLPFLAVAIAFVVGYSVLAWALVYQTSLLALDEQVTTLYLPFTLAWPVTFFAIWPRIKLLRLETGWQPRPGFYFLVAAATMIAPTILAQEYLARATPRLARLGDVSEIAAVPATRYYAVDRPCLRMDDRQFHMWADLSRRDRRVLTFTIAAAVPFCGPGGSRSYPPPAWLGVSYYRSIQADLDQEEREAAARAFAEESQASFDKTDLGGFAYLEEVGPGDMRRRLEAVIRKGVYAGAEPRILVAHHDAFEDRTGHLLAWTFGSFGFGAAVWLVLLGFPRVHGGRLRRLVDGAPAEPARPRRWLALLWSFKSATVVMAWLNVGVFLVMAFAGLGVAGFRVDDLVSWGATSRPLLHGVGVVRLVTSQFVHDGLMHLMANLYGLLVAGILLEPIIGRRRLVLGYLLTGTVGGLCSALIHPSTVTVGASGSILGLFGVMFGLLVTGDPRVAPMRKFLLTNVGVFLGMNLLIGAASPGVDNAAHLGGLIAGLLLAPLLGHFRRTPGARHGAG